jgi:glycosyltransferase involved in cell wall biosynthesis
MRVLQINTSINSGSTGRIAEEIGRMLIEKGHQSYMAYGNIVNNSISEAVKIGNRMDFIFHVLKSRLFDRHGFGSVNATRSFINQIEQINPDLIHLHNIHGYYLNSSILFEYLKKEQKPVVWTFHDCWPFTGHCSHFDFVNCYKWQAECFACPNTHKYPKSLLIDNSRSNFRQKKVLYNGLSTIKLVSPSEWLAGFLRRSFLSGYETKVINNGIDLDKFKPVHDKGLRKKYDLDKKYIIGVASNWTAKKGLFDFIQLRSLLDMQIDILLVGLKRNQIKSLPEGIKGIFRTERIEEIAALYSGAEVFVNPTYVDNFPSVNIEALACGTPVITYETGGSPETIDSETGKVVRKGDVAGLKSAISELLLKDRQALSGKCRRRAEMLYDSKHMSNEYIALYEKFRKG